MLHDVDPEQRLGLEPASLLLDPIRELGSRFSLIFILGAAINLAVGFVLGGIPCLGRGSAAGSLALYALGATWVDPLANNLSFERFLNPERISMPDIDIDFCINGRDDVIQYVAETYGRENVGQIITFGTMKLCC